MPYDRWALAVPPFVDPQGGERWMALIAVERAAVGMVLATEVTDRRGRMLIPAGKALEEKYLNALLFFSKSDIREAALQLQSGSESTEDTTTQ